MADQKVLIESLNFKQAMKFIWLHERQRHLDDVDHIDRNLEQLADVELPEGIDVTVWFDVR